MGWETSPLFFFMCICREDVGGPGRPSPLVKRDEVHMHMHSHTDTCTRTLSPEKRCICREKREGCTPRAYVYEAGVHLQEAGALGEGWKDRVHLHL
jgi:hypothetical protein